MTAIQPEIFIIDDDPLMSECIARAAQKITHPKFSVQMFTDVIAAIEALNVTSPSLILLDILLNGPDGFTLLNELMSYSDTAQIPIIIISSLNFAHVDLTHYGVVEVLQKEVMTPLAIQSAIKKAYRSIQAENT